MIGDLQEEARASSTRHLRGLGAFVWAANRISICAQSFPIHKRSTNMIVAIMNFQKIVKNDLHRPFCNT